MDTRGAIAIAIALNDSQSMDAYVADGRACRDLTDDDLVLRWEIALEEFLPWPPKQAALRDESDLRHEAELRGIELPRHAMEKILAAARGALTKLSEDPASLQRMAESIGAMMTEVEQFLRMPRN